MKKINRYYLILLIGILISIGGCQDEYELGDIIVPSNLDITYTIVGESDTTLYGDGSGQVIFSADAEGNNL